MRIIHNGSFSPRTGASLGTDWSPNRLEYANRGALADTRFEVETMIAKWRGSGTLLVVALIASLVPLVPQFASPARADGSPDISMTATMTPETLYGATSTVDLSASNSSGTDGFNLSFRVVLPEGVSYSSGPVAPTILADVPGVGETTLFFVNYSDLPDGGDSGFSFEVAHDTSILGVGDSFTLPTDAYVNDDPRIVPKIDASGNVTDGPGFASDSTSTVLVPFIVDKSEPSPEAELMRGLHDHQTVYTITIQQAPVGDSSDFSVEDWIPAGIEFLGCGGAVDNSTVGEEYPGSGPITGPVVPTCPTPVVVETIDSGLPAGVPAGTYTHVVWDEPAIAALGGGAIPAGTSFSFNYAAAIPMNENTTTWAGAVPPTTGEQGSNIDNNNGPSTAETATEKAYTNYVEATGTYDLTGEDYTDDTDHTVIAEDVAITKTVNPTVSSDGLVSTWTITIRTSEYATTTTDIVLRDLVPTALCPGGTPCATTAPGPSVPYTSATETAGITTLTWNLADLAASSTQVITYSTEQRTFYAGTVPPIPIAAGDSWSNEADIFARVDGVSVGDSSQDSQTTVRPSPIKEVAEPGPVPMVCGDGSSLTWDVDSAGIYQPGDRVCWRLRVPIPNIAGKEQRIVDYLPPGFEFESWAFGAGNTVPELLVNYDGSGESSGVLIWSGGGPGGNSVPLPPNSVFEVVISSIGGPPDSGEPGDLLQNLMKHSGESTQGDFYFNRTDADVEWGYPIVEQIDKTADATEVIADQVVSFTVDVANDGNVAAFNTVIWDILPVGLECNTVSAISGGGTCDTGPDPDRIVWTIPSIAAGATLGLTYQVTIPSDVGPGEEWTNNVGVRSYQGEINTGVNDFTDYYPENNIDPTVPEENAPEALDEWTLFVTRIVLNKTGTTSLNDPGNNFNNRATIGETVFYTVEVLFPEGTTAYDNPLLTDAVPDELVYQGDAEACIGPAATPCNPATDPLPPNVVLDDTNDIITLSYPGSYSVPPGGGDILARLTFSAIVDDEPTNVRGRLVRNTARFRWEDSEQRPRIAQDSKSGRIVEPNLTVEKTNNDADGVVDAGQTVTWTLDVTNDNSIQYVTSAYDVVIVDRLPPNLTCGAVSNISNGGVCVAFSGDEYVVWGTAQVPGLVEMTRGTTISVSFDVTIPSPVVAGTPFVNTVNVYGSSLPGNDPNERIAPILVNGDVADSGPDGYFATDQDTLIAPQVDIDKSVAPTEETVGESPQFTIEATIPAGVVVYDLTVIDAVPGGFVVPSSGYTVSTSCTQNGGACVPPVAVAELLANGNDIGWFLGDQPLPATEDRVIEIVYNARIADIGGNIDGTDLTNTVTVYANQTNQIPSSPPQVPDAPNYDLSGPDATATVTVREPDVSITKEVFDGSTWVDARRAVPGESLDYRLVLENTGNWPAYDLVVTDSISTFSGDAMELGTVADGPGYTVTDGDPSDATLGWSADGPLAAGGTLTITYTLDVWDADSGDEDPSGPEITNTAALTEYWAVANPDPTIHREYSDGDDSVSIELDLASIGDYVWFDINADGVQDSGEPPLEGVEVTITYLGPDGNPGGGDDEVTIETTDPSGLYLAEDLPGGEYIVEVTGGVPPGMAPSFDLDDGIVSPDGAWAGTLAENADKDDVDFGYTGTGSIGDLVWFNRNGDAVQDAQEPGLPGVNGQIDWFGFDGVLGGGDDITYVFTTDANGNYLVENLPAGGYITSIVGGVPAGMAANYDDDGGDDEASEIVLGAGENNTDQDFGYAGDSSIGDRVWLDLDGDGIDDPGEPGLANIVVELDWPGPDGISGNGDDVTFTETTDAAGAYLFGGLNPGDYPTTVDVSTLPSGVVNTYDEDGNQDSTVTVTLPSSTDHDTADFGYAGNGEIGDEIYWDTNGNGSRDVGEPGIPNITVESAWVGPDGTSGTADDVIETVVSDAAGNYLFTERPAGDYTITVLTVINATNSGDPDGGGDSTAALTLAPGASNLGQDFGYSGTAQIGDFVWWDLNSDGVQDPSEPGLAGVDIELTFYGLDNTIGTPDDLTFNDTTAAGGAYLFENLVPGTYLVEVQTGTVPVGMVNTFDRDGNQDDETEVTLATVDAQVLDADFGYAGSSSIGDFVWHDDNGDGVQDVGEPGLAGVDVELIWPGFDGVAGTPDDLTLTATTDVAGAYLFDGLNANDYEVTVVLATVPPGFVNTFDEDGNMDDMVTVNLPDSTDHLTADFGYDGEGAIGDFIWWDLNGDGAQDPGEPGIPDVDVEILWAGLNGVFGDADDVVYSATTDATGAYGVSGLAPGEFRVTVVGPITTAAINTGDPDGGNDNTSELTLGSTFPASVNLDQDFGYSGDATIGDFVWHDINGDAVQDLGEPGFDNVEVTLTYYGLDGVIGGTDNVVRTTDTAAGGAYLFEFLPSGTYLVEIATADLPPGVVQTFDRDTILDDETEVDLTLGDAVDDADFGYTGTGEIGDFVWWDLNADGNQDSGEPGWPNVDVTVTYAGPDGTFGTADDAVQTTITDANGGYLVGRLLSGPHRVEIDASDLPPDVISTANPTGNPFDSDVTLGAGESNLDQDFGYAGENELGDFVWLDANADTVQDALEPGAANAALSVVWAGPNGAIGDADDLTIFTATDLDGIYGQGGLVDGLYEVRLDVGTIPAGWVPNSDVDGGDPAISQVTFPEIQQPPFNGGAVSAFEIRDDVDFGLVSEAMLSGNVWHDVNADTVNDPLEFGLENVAVIATWSGPLGDIEFSFTTNGMGDWILPMAPPGDYTVVADETTVPAGFVNTTPLSVAVAVPVAGDGYVEHGFVGSASIGSTVWVDTNDNGIKDGAEQGIAGVAVELQIGAVTLSTTTNAGGTYLFTDLVPGIFTVSLDPDTIPDNLVQTYSKDGVLDLTTSGTVSESEAVLDVNFGFQEEELPVTGGPLDRFLYFAMLLIGAGVLAVLVSRRRED